MSDFGPYSPDIMASTTTASEHRLPTNVKPTHYDISIRTDLDKLTFDGFVKISLDIKENTDTIVLNSNGLKLGKASATSDASKGSLVVETKQTFDDQEKRVTFQFPTEFKAGTKAQIQVGFSGELGDSMVGYYRSSWEQDGQKKYYALTQFEPVDARRAFPCWDEPELKATFAITQISKVNTTNISNMSAIEEKTFSAQEHSYLTEHFESLDSQWKVTRFETTPPMSTYIVAFANGEFSHLETSVKMPLSGKTIPLRIYATADVIHQAQFALDVKAKVLPIYEKVFDVEYPAAEAGYTRGNDFDAGAMENWGLITGRARAFLLDPNSPDIQAKKYVVDVMSHEVAHMWFGNITTMKWWDYLYLNEGFATLMGEVIIPDFRPVSDNRTGRTPNLRPTLSSSTAILLPRWLSMLNCHRTPLKFHCPNADYIGQVLAPPQPLFPSHLSPRHFFQIFDALSYSKAGSVLRMLAAHVGVENFLKGVSIYLKKHLYGNSTTRDLWDGISESTGQDIVKLMDNWITKVGFPVLTVTETDSGIKVRQDRFLETGIAESKDNETIWNVPLSILSVGSDGKPTIDNSAVLGAREKTYSLDTSKPFKLNAGTNGVFRVVYSEERYKKIASELAKPDSPFSLEDRLGLISDSLALSKAALLKLSDALTLIDALRDEKEYLPWSGISGGLRGISSVWWEHPEIIDSLDAFRRSLFAPLVKNLGYEYSDSDSVETTQLRTCAIEHALSAGDTGVIEELKGRFKHYVDTGDDSRIPPDLQKAIFTAGIKYGGRAEFDFTKKIFEKPKTPSARAAAIAALTSTEDEKLLAEVMEIARTGARDQDVTIFFRGWSQNPKARRPGSAFFRKYYDEFYKRFSETFTLKYLVQESFAVLSTEKDLKETEAFFEGKETSKYSLALAQSLDSIRARIAFIKHSTDDLQKWLKERK
ncbi:Aminopeptidase 2 mitochondrial [Marasmius tenuissimus]|uniref:Aminopeptidase n=1 Tax=Marasmius tenuissimus TaxID=585030 RepID=A0ABR2ZY05_9AGAR